MLDYELSHEIAGALGLEVQQCWQNSLKTLRSRYCGKKCKQGVTYVEGWTVTKYQVAIEHGWLELEDGTILDPTYTLTSTENDARWIYFPGVRYTKEDLKGISLSVLPLVWYTHGTWANNEAYLAAYKNARSIAG